MYLATTALPLVFAVSALATCLAPTSEVSQYTRVRCLRAYVRRLEADSVPDPVLDPSTVIVGFSDHRMTKPQPANPTRIYHPTRAHNNQDFWSLLQHLAEAWALHSLNNLIVERLGTLYLWFTLGPTQSHPPFAILVWT